MTAPRADLDELGRLLAEATPGPWQASSERADGGGYIDTRATLADGSAPWVGHASRVRDAALIAALVNAAPALLAEVAELRETVARVEALAAGPAADGYRPYAVSLDDGVHLAVLLDDLRAAVGAESCGDRGHRCPDCSAPRIDGVFGAES